MRRASRKMACGLLTGRQTALPVASASARTDIAAGLEFGQGALRQSAHWPPGTWPSVTKLGDAEQRARAPIANVVGGNQRILLDDLLHLLLARPSAQRPLSIFFFFFRAGQQICLCPLPAHPRSKNSCRRQQKNSEKDG
eukprot:TRINITY_DN1809_c0_g1_i27.p2 TRINITY_DN1809_c0_g1~~TRINITY_DN1809_c0_g1_i27.p2  ORF type:complete len:139 (-),score=19.93 TRINITY_DN1809_c0_g1_i27:39-455(-)